ncbi:MAG: hypothetical protein K2Z81_18880, partial [Cyanobacteria bacterium]|nr:hypothetical protein [Cyanobacteriota bacterium]
MRSESNADYHAFDGNVVPDQSVPESRFRDLAMIEIVAQGAALNPPRTTPDVISCDLFDCFIELEEESASPSANAGSKKEFSDVRITPESIEKADKESAEFLKNLGVRQLIVLKDGESRRVAVEFSRSQSIPINRDGCRDVVLSGSVGGRLTASADGKSAVISSIRGIEANIDLPDELRFLGGNSTTVDVKRVNFFEKDGVPMMEITGSKFDVEMSRTVPVPPEVMAIRQNVERLAENLGDQPQLNEADRRLVEDLTRDSGMPLYLKLAILAAGIGVLASKGHPLSIRDWLFGRGRQEASSQGDRKPSETREDTAGRSDGRGTERSASEKNAG